MQPNETIQLADLLNGLVELNAVGDNPSPQHFTPPDASDFDLPIYDGQIIPDMPMKDYLELPQIGSTTFSAIEQSELSMWHQMHKKNETKPHLTTGTVIHDYIEWWAAGKSLEEYFNGIRTVPNYSRASLDGVAMEILYYATILGISPNIPDKIADRKLLADSLRADCESKCTLVSEKDAELIRGIAAEMQRRHEKTGFLDWLRYAKSEWTFIYKHFKVRPDLLGRSLIVSVKTCAKIENAAKIANYDYGIKEAYYRHVIESVTGVPHNTAFLFFSSVTCESRLIFVSPKTAQYYDKIVKELVVKANRCLDNNKFRGYEANLEYGVEII